MGGPHIIRHIFQTAHAPALNALAPSTSLCCICSVSSRIITPSCTEDAVCCAQLAYHILRGDLPTLVLTSIMTATWDIPPRIGHDVFLLHLLEPAVQIIWLHHASGASPAALALMPNTQADAELLEVLEYGMTRVRRDACMSRRARRSAARCHDDQQ